MFNIICSGKLCYIYELFNFQNYTIIRNESQIKQEPNAVPQI